MHETALLSHTPPFQPSCPQASMSSSFCCDSPKY